MSNSSEQDSPSSVVQVRASCPSTRSTLGIRALMTLSPYFSSACSLAASKPLPWVRTSMKNRAMSRSGLCSFVRRPLVRETDYMTFCRPGCTGQPFELQAGDYVREAPIAEPFQNGLVCPAKTRCQEPGPCMSGHRDYRSHSLSSGRPWDLCSSWMEWPGHSLCEGHGLHPVFHYTDQQPAWGNTLYMYHRPYTCLRL